MSYAVKEIFYTLQGEGAQTGRPSVFLRFSGCNLWSGREADRHKAICQFCDTDFWGTDGVNGGKYPEAQDLAQKVASLWPKANPHIPYVVCTGGEPLLQLDCPLIDALHSVGFEVAVETNGTIEAPPGIDWLCMSPKAGTEIRQKSGSELKIVYPQVGIDPADFAGLKFDHFFLQPMDSDNLEEYTSRVIDYCANHPQWHLSIQSHKLLEIP